MRAAALALLFAAALAAQNRVTAVRHSVVGDVTRVAIQTTERPEWSGDAASNPDRLYFDIRSSVIRLEEGLSAKAIPLGGALARQARLGMNQPRVARVVIDLHRPVDYSVSVLPNPWRLMVEMRPKGTAAPAPEPVAEAPKPVAPEPKAEPKPEPKPEPVKEVPAPVTPAAAEPAPTPEHGPEPEPAHSVVLTKPPKPARTNPSTGNPSLTRALGLKLSRVVIDAGHGGHDHGTTGVSGLKEKDLVLDIARRVGALVEANLGAQVIYTRTEDVFIPLEERTALANRSRADLFLSIHANSSPYRKVAGPETFYLSLTNSRDDLDVAARENAASGHNIFELQSLLQKIATHDKVKESSEFAGHVQRAMFQTVSRSNGVNRNRGVKKAPFVVLIGAKMPSILAEVGFLSNAKEEGLLKRDAYRQRIAEALVKGVERYAATLSQMEVARETRPPGLD